VIGTQKLQELLDRFAVACGLEPIAADSMGHFRIRFDFRNALDLIALDSRSVLIRANLRSLESYDVDTTEDIVHRCLQFGMTRLQEFAETLTYDAPSQQLIVYRLLDLETLDDAILEQAIEDFMNSTSAWKAFVQQTLEAVNDQTSEPFNAQF